MRIQLPKWIKYAVFIIVAVIVAGLGYFVSLKADVLLYATLNADKVRAVIRADQALQGEASRILVNILSQTMTEANLVEK
jgi:hypothetical protein